MLDTTLVLIWLLYIHIFLLCTPCLTHFITMQMNRISNWLQNQKEQQKSTHFCGNLETFLRHCFLASCWQSNSSQGNFSFLGQEITLPWSKNKVVINPTVLNLGLMRMVNYNMAFELQSDIIYSVYYGRNMRCNTTNCLNMVSVEASFTRSRFLTSPGRKNQWAAEQMQYHIL